MFCFLGKKSSERKNYVFSFFFILDGIKNLRLDVEDSKKKKKIKKYNIIMHIIFFVFPFSSHFPFHLSRVQVVHPFCFDFSTTSKVTPHDECNEIAI